MCGIAGYFNVNGRSADETVGRKMIKAVAHRGPDGEGVHVHENVVLAHRRLSILDLSEHGAQPMRSQNGRWAITFNGCIYNYRELRKELLNKGYSFRSNTDTEVIANGLDAEGTSFFARLDGMFAVAAYDKEEKSFYLSRDRFGVKPLYYWFNGSTLAFGSEIKAILQHPEYKVGVNMDALNQYFTFQNVFTYNTLFDGVMMLPPANTLRFTTETRQIRHDAWWDYDFKQPDNTMTFEDAVEETKRLFEEAVTRQMISDVPVGSYLSGGMDSGSITAVASRHVNRLSTFTCGFDMSHVSGYEANYDERRDAELTASYFRTEHFEQVINAGDLSWSLPRVVNHIEDLRVGMSYPNYYIARLASKFVKVCLQGTGGDELFGGYPWRYYRVFDALNQEQFFDQYYDFWQRLVPDNERNQLFTPDTQAKMAQSNPRLNFERVFTFQKGIKFDTPEQHINNSLYFEIKTFLPGLLLVGDKLSMAHGLEERFPFLDNALVDFAMKIPVRHKLGNLQREIKRIDENVGMKKHSYREFDDGKAVLRKAMADFLPDRIINRKKQGFSAPDESWYRGANAEFVKDLLLKSNTVSAEFINRDYMKHVVHEHMEKGVNHRLLLWSFMNFEWWCRIFLHGEPLPES